MKKTIKILSVLSMVLLLIFAISMSIAAVDSNDPYNSSYSVSVSRETEKQVMERFKEAVTSGNAVNVTGLNVLTQDVQNLQLAFSYEYPMYSFMFKSGQISSTYDPFTGYVMSINITYNYNSSVFSSAFSEIETEVTNICAKINPGWSDIQKILWVNDYMCDVYEYDYSLQSDNLYSMISLKKGTCQGYTKLFKAIMDKLGIECSFSSSNQIEHVWNIVKVDGQWYHVDVTWNDNPSTRGRILLSNDTNSYKEHAAGYKNLATVTDAIQKYKCTSTKYNNYFWTNSFASGFGFEGTTTAYAFDPSGNFKKYNLSDGSSTILFTNSDKWAATTPGYYWTDYYGDVVSMGDVMFYSTSRAVYSYNTSTGTSTKIYETNQYYIYAILYDGTNIYFIDYNYDINARPLNKSMYYFTAPSVSSKFTVIWKNYDGTVLETDENVTFGSTPTYNGATPTRTGTAEYTYTFTGWTPSLSNVTGDVTYTATFEQTKSKYTITWKNYDGSVIKTEEVEYGKTPSYTGTTPVKPSDSQYSYTFSGWSPSVSQVTGDATYTAQFSQTAATFTVTWKNDDGTILKTDTNQSYGSTPSYTGATPTKKATAEYTYTFTGWTPAITSVTGDVTYTATYSQTKKTYTIIWQNYDGSTLKTDILEYGAMPSYTGTTPTRASDGNFEYKFKGWTPTISSVTKGTVYRAEYTASKITTTTGETTIETTAETTTVETTTATTTETTTESTTETTTETTTKETTTETVQIETTTETTTESTSKETTETTEVIETTEIIETTDVTETTEVIETSEVTETTESTNDETETTEYVSTGAETTDVVTTDVETTNGSVETTDIESTEETTVGEVDTTTDEVVTTTDETETTTEKVTETKSQETTHNNQESFDFMGFVNNVIEQIKEGNVVYIAVTAGAGVVLLSIIILILKAIFKKKK